MVGREMFTTLASRVDMKIPMEILKVTHHRWSILERNMEISAS
jgi:hypothetical protein